MGVSLGPLNLPIFGPENPSATAPTAPAANQTPSSAPPATVQTSAAPPTLPISTDLRIDDRDQVYYKFVDGQTGEVVFEIPPEALRAIAESLNVSLLGTATGYNIDVKS